MTAIGAHFIPRTARAHAMMRSGVMNSDSGV
jgi:hypothetical protein